LPCLASAKRCVKNPVPSITVINTTTTDNDINKIKTKKDEKTYVWWETRINREIEGIVSLNLKSQFQV
jgi:hypothetical protein